MISKSEKNELKSSQKYNNQQGLELGLRLEVVEELVMRLVNFFISVTSSSIPDCTM